MASPTESNQAPEVSPSDLRAVWTLMQNLQAHGQPGESTAIDIRTYRSVCSPDADALAVWARTLILQIMNHVLHGWSDRAKMDKSGVDLEGGESVDIHLIAPPPGSYEMHCSHFMHSSFGMTGTIVVR